MIKKLDINRYFIGRPDQSMNLNNFVKIYPYLKGFTDDLLFFIAIDTLFLTVAKGLDAEQIIFLTTVSTFVSIICRLAFINIIRKIGNTKSVRLGMGLLLLSAILITFGNSYLWIMLGKIFYEVSGIFKDMDNVMLKNNLTVMKQPEKYAEVADKGMNVYAFLTFAIALVSGFLFNISPYLPMYLCILVCFIAFIVYFYMKDVSTNNIIKEKRAKSQKIKFSKIIWIILISYGIFYGIITLGQQNTKLRIQYNLSDAFDIAKVATYLAFIVAAARGTRLLANLIYGKIYYKIKDKSLPIITIFLFSAFVFIILGYFIPLVPLKLILMAIGFCIILAARDPFKLYISDTVLEITNPNEHQVVVSYIQFARKLGTTIFSLLVSATLLKWPLIYVIFGISILSIIEIFIAVKLYYMLGLNKKT